MESWNSGNYNASLNDCFNNLTLREAEINNLLSENIEASERSQLLNLNKLTTQQCNTSTANLLGNGFHSNQASGSNTFMNLLGNTNHMNNTLFENSVLNPQNNNNNTSYNYHGSSLHNESSNGYHNNLSSKHMMSNNGNVHNSNLSSDDSTMCKLHSQYFSQFCITCNKLVCPLCTRNEHAYHNIESLKDTFEKTKINVMLTRTGAIELMKSLNKSKYEVESIEKHLSFNSVKQKKLITETARILHVQVQNMEEKALKEVESIEKSKLEILQKQSGTIEATCVDVEKILSDLQNILNVNNLTVKLFSDYQKCQNKLASLRKLDCYHANEDSDLSFSPKNDHLVTVGEVVSSVLAKNCEVAREGGNSCHAICGALLYFVVHVKDHLGNPKSNYNLSKFVATVSGPKENQDFRCTLQKSPNLNNVILFNFKLLQEGKHLIRVRCRGVDVGNSPYVIQARRAVEYKRRVGKVMLGGEGELDGMLCRPWGITTDHTGHIIVADRSNHRIQVFSSEGIFSHKFGRLGSDVGLLNRPAGVAVDDRRNIIVADKDNHRVQVFTFEGRFVLQFGGHGSRPGQFNYPWDVAVNKDGSRIVVTDTRNHRIQMFDGNGRFITKYGFDTSCDRRRYFDAPRGVAWLSDGRVAVTDFNLHRVVIVEPNMQQARFIGGEGGNYLQFRRPQGIAVDQHGNIVVSDSRNSRVQVFTDPGTQLVTVFDRVTMTNPQQNMVAMDTQQPLQAMDRPAGVAVSPNGEIIVIDFGNSRVVSF